MYRIIGLDSKGGLIDLEAADLDDLMYELIWYRDTEGLYDLQVTRGNSKIEIKVTDDDITINE